MLSKQGSTDHQLQQGIWKGGFQGRLALSFPHKFRHGNAVYSLKQARNVPELKAISQNLMHSNLNITDGVYGILSDSDTKSFIANLATNRWQTNWENIDTIKEILSKLLRSSRVSSEPLQAKRNLVIPYPV